MTAAGFNPDQPRDDHGEWSGGGGEGPSPSTQAARDLAEHYREVPPITVAEARGNSRPVSAEEFQRLAAEGKAQVDAWAANASPITGLEGKLDNVKADAYRACQESWGGATIDAHTGEALATDADKYALSVKPVGMNSVSVPETASQAEFNDAVDHAVDRFRPELEKQNAHLGIFHDDDHQRIDIDPVVVVDTLHQVETIGAYTHAIGGAYRFSDGNGYWPPHVAEVTAAGTLDDMAPLGKKVKWKGPGQWRSAAVEAQGSETKPPNAPPDKPQPKKP